MADNDIEPSKEIELTEQPLIAPSSSQKEIKAAKERSVFFNDGVRKIDFILTYAKTTQKDGTPSDKENEKEEMREYFTNQLIKAGVEIEIQNPDESPDCKTTFVKIHGTWKILAQYAEKINLRVPIHDQDTSSSTLLEKILKCCKIKDPTEPVFPEKFQAKDVYTAIFKPQNLENFIGHENKDTFFTDAQRSLIIYNLLMDTPYKKNDPKTGIDRLLDKGVYSAAFPLHDGNYYVKPRGDPINFRQSLFREWASPWAFYKKQPLDEIREYFGEKVAIYFAFLGTYTKWLHLSTIIGILVFIYGLTTLGTARNPIARQACNDPPTDYYMCPICNGGKCDFWFLESACTAFWFALLFDNEGTVLFAIFMSFWCTLFLESWKRQQSTLQYEWDLLGFEEEEQQPRPKYELGVKRGHEIFPERWKAYWFDYDPVTKIEEFKQPQFIFFSKIMGTISILATTVTVVVIFVIAVIFYKVLTRNELSVIAARDGYASIVPFIGICVSISAAVLQLVFIVIMNKIYTYLALILTDWELHRTQTEHEDSFTFKMFVFQCVNFYSSIFYIAFIKGKLFVPYPGIPGFKLEECQPYGCLLELCLQLAIVFLGKQILNNGKELGVPVVKYIIKRLINWFKNRKKTEADKEEDIYTRYEQDFDLPPEDSFGLFGEYLELIIQFGFVTLFVASFPLAPFFALLNNYAEIRLDAFKYLCLQRKVVAIRAADIGIWYSILDTIAKCAVISNAFLIAFTATFIDRASYASINPLGIANYDNLDGFFNWTLGIVPIENLLDSVTFPDPSFQRLTDPNCTDDEGCPLYQPYLSRAIECCGSNNSPNCSTIWNVTAPGVTCCESIRIQAPAANVTDILYRNLPNSSYDDSLYCNVSRLVPGQFCRFRGRFQPNPFAENSPHNEYFFRVSLAKVVFVLLFEHFVFILTALIAWLIPDIPESIQTMILREKHLTRQAFFEYVDRTKSPSKAVGRGGDEEAEA
ncbi:Anoctamin-7-like [Oopsacas minuta]|uniref:Anoctamin n=1 Tax=Oopsacas minuta TaxID=111878 RepID=A0AAV7K9Z9_9METZ|nr:Anoctamin-7-like [Oopsacas minuta]